MKVRKVGPVWGPLWFLANASYMKLQTRTLATPGPSPPQPDWLPVASGRNICGPQHLFFFNRWLTPKEVWKQSMADCFLIFLWISWSWIALPWNYPGFIAISFLASKNKSRRRITVNSCVREIASEISPRECRDVDSLWFLNPFGLTLGW